MAKTKKKEKENATYGHGVVPKFGPPATWAEAISRLEKTIRKDRDIVCNRIYELEQRIDRIVAAIDKCKRVKGL